MSSPMRVGNVEGYKCVKGVFEPDCKRATGHVYGVLALPLAAGNRPGCVHIPSPINWAALRNASDPETNAMRYLYQLMQMVLENKTLGTPYLKKSTYEDIESLEKLDSNMTYKGKVIPTAFETPQAAVEGSSVFSTGLGYILNDYYYDDAPKMTLGEARRVFTTSLPTATPVATRHGPLTSVSQAGARPATAPPFSGTDAGTAGAGTFESEIEAMMGVSMPSGTDDLPVDILASNRTPLDGTVATSTHFEHSSLAAVQDLDVSDDELDAGYGAGSAGGTGPGSVPATETLATQGVPRAYEEMEKIMVAVEPVYRGGKPRTMEHYLGCILKVYVLDPNLNLGLGLENLFNFESNKHCFRRTGGIDPTKFIKSQLDRLQAATDGTHACRALNPSQYTNAVRVYIQQCISGRAGREVHRMRNVYLSPQSNRYSASGKFQDFGNPFNPMNVFTLENALYFMEHLHTVNMESYGPQNYISPHCYGQEFQIWSGIQSPQPTYLYRQDNFVWVSKAGIGLCGQLLPWVDDIYREFCKIIVPLSAVRQLEIMQRLVDSELEHFVPLYLMDLYRECSEDYMAMSRRLHDFLATYDGHREDLLEKTVRSTDAGQNMVETSFANSAFMQTIHSSFEANRPGMDQSSSLNWIIGFREFNGGIREAIASMHMRMSNGKPLALEFFPQKTRLMSLAQWNAQHLEYSRMMLEVSRHLALYFKSQVWQRNAVLTRPMKAMYNFQHNSKGRGRAGFRRVTSPNEIKDLSLDYFGNYMQDFALHLRYIKDNYKCVRNIVILRFGPSYDCFRQAWDMHFHTCATGPYAASKSHAANQAKNYCVDGTVMQTTDSSALADTVDEDKSDEWNIYDEAPAFMVRPPGVKTDDDPSTSRIKSILTECVLSRRVLILGDADSTGRRPRSNQIVHTNIIQTLSLSSNVSASQIPSAVRSRMYMEAMTAITSNNADYKSLDEIFADSENWVDPEDATETRAKQRRDEARRTTADQATAMGTKAAAGTKTGKKKTKKGKSAAKTKKGAEFSIAMPKTSPNDVQMVSPGNTETAKINDEIKRGRIMHFLVAMINKFIYIGVLPEPNMEVAHRIIFRLLRYLRQKGKMTNTSVRDYQRIIIMARSLTLVNAVLSTFHNIYTATYMGREFEIEHLIHVAPHLVCTKQVAIFAFTLLQQQYVAPMEAAVITALLKIAKYPQQGFAKANRARRPAYAHLFNDDPVDIEETIRQFENMDVGDSDGDTTLPPEFSGSAPPAAQSDAMEVGADGSVPTATGFGTPGVFQGSDDDNMEDLMAGILQDDGDSADEDVDSREDTDAGAEQGAPSADEETSELDEEDDIVYKTPLEWYHHTVQRGSVTTTWRMFKNMDDSSLEVGKTYVNLNYVAIEGSIRDVATRVVNMIPERYSIDDVEAFITDKSREFIDVPNAYAVVTADALVGSQVRQSREKLPVVELINGHDKNSRTSVNVCVYAMNHLVSQSLIEDAIRSLAHKSMRPQNYLLGSMTQLGREDIGLFDRVAITAEDCRNAKYDGFLVASPIYMPPKLRRMMFIDATTDPDELGYDASTGAMKMLDKGYAKKFFSEQRGVSYETDYHEGRFSKVLCVNEDLDDWAFAEHYVKAGIPMRCVQGVNGAFTYEWLPLTVDPESAGSADWKPLPTPFNQMKEFRRRLRKDQTAQNRLHHIHNNKPLKRIRQTLEGAPRPTLYLGPALGETEDGDRREGDSELSVDAMEE